MSNELRLTVVRDALAESGHPTNIQEEVEYFLTAFMTIFNARNTLMHSAPTSQPFFLDTDPAHMPIVLQKQSKKTPGTTDLYVPSLADLRSLADSARAFRIFGWNLHSHIFYVYEREKLEKLLSGFTTGATRDLVRKDYRKTAAALPDRPPPPAPLNPHHP